MVAKLSVCFLLLAMFVAASMQMPDPGAMSRVKRADEPEETAETTPEPEAGGESGAEGSDGGEHAEGDKPKPSGGGFSGIGGGGNGGGGPFPQGVPGKDFFSKVMQSFSGKPPKPEEWIKGIPFMNTFFSDEQIPA